MHKKKVFISYQKIREWLCFHFESDNSWNRIFDTSNRIGGGRGWLEVKSRTTVTQESGEKYPPEKAGVYIYKFLMRPLKTNNEKYSYWIIWLSVGELFFSSNISDTRKSAKWHPYSVLYKNISVFSKYRVLKTHKEEAVVYIKGLKGRIWESLVYY